MNKETTDIHKLFDSEDDEKTGAHAKRGFQYQDWWCTLQAFELWAKSELDFAIGAEVKEDLAIIDSTSNPSVIEFHQIKKKETGNWSAKDLIKVTSKNKINEKSIISKLYSRHIALKPIQTKLFFISNAKLKAKNKKNIEEEHHDSNFLEKLHDEVLYLLEKPLRLQLELPETEKIDYSKLNFKITRMAVDDPDTHVMGKVFNLNEDNEFPIKLSNIRVAAFSITNQFNKMSSNTDFASNIEQLYARCLSRENFEKIITNIEKTTKTLELYMEEGIEVLSSEDFPFLKRRKLKIAAPNVLLDIRDRTKSHVQELFKEIHEIYMNNILQLETYSTLTQINDSILKELLTMRNQIFSIDYLYCSILLYTISGGEIYCDKYFNI